MDRQTIQQEVALPADLVNGFCQVGIVADDDSGFTIFIESVQKQIGSEVHIGTFLLCLPYLLPAHAYLKDFR